MTSMVTLSNTLVMVLVGEHTCETTIKGYIAIAVLRRNKEMNLHSGCNFVKSIGLLFIYSSRLVKEVY